MGHMAGLAPQSGDVDEGFALLEARAGQVADEQTIADLDQTTSDADETGSESDQTASDRDKAQADAVQRTSNRDRVAADRERAADPALDVSPGPASRYGSRAAALSRNTQPLGQEYP
jgi:hypothetical protein